MAFPRAAPAARIPMPDPLARAAALERARDFSGALAAYEEALRSAPEDPDILAPLAALADRLEMYEVAARLWEEVSRLDPARLAATHGRARAWRELGQFEAATAVLRQTLLSHPDDAASWNSLGVTLMQAGRAGEAIAFLDEAARLDARDPVAVYNRGSARFDLGELDAAEVDFATALRLARRPAEAATIRFAAALLTLARGDLAAGWEAYEARHSRHLNNALVFDAPGRRWGPDAALAGRRLLLIGEQGLGDEIMFASMIPDVLRALGPDGALSLAVEPRLVALFRRSFPQAEVVAHATEAGGTGLRRAAPGLERGRAVELWAPMGAMARGFRRTLADFPTGAGYLAPDPARVAHWRAWLGEGPPAVGLSWRSGKMLGDRRRQYPPVETWGPALRTPGVRFVNVQYGDCAEGLGAFRERFGCEVLEPPGLDIREDIDGLAALCSALDLTVCVANATGALVGACGVPAILISPPAAWPRLGTAHLPWYPQAHTVTAPAFDAWGPTLAQAAVLMGELVGARAPIPAGPQ